MKILDMPCTKGFMQLAQDGVDKGWHEMNGGNLSYCNSAEVMVWVEGRASQ